MRRTLLLLAGVIALPLILTGRALPQKQTDAALPEKFDLREVGAVTPIKKQQGGTCWTHGTMAAIESNLILSGTWKKLGNKDQPAMSEYHLDWWNGFNRHVNDDVADATKETTGVTVHQGGDYRVSAAYISRGDGAVVIPMKDGVQDSKVWYKETPPRRDPSFKRFYVRDIEWFTIGDNLEGIDVLKRRIMAEGAIGTAYASGKNFIGKDFVHYQPKDNKSKPNHSVAIVGWDDTKLSTDDAKKAPKPGAWLIKNSWGPTSGDKGYYWISFYDKVSCRDPELGAASFRNIEPMAYDHVYYHDVHGWRGTLPNISKAFNAYTAAANQDIKAVSFYTTKDNSGYVAKIYRKFEGGKLGEEVASVTGQIRFNGFHTVDLPKTIGLKKGEKFYVFLDVTSGGQAIDRTSEIPVLLEQKKASGPKGPNGGPIVLSKSNAGESFYLDQDGTWKDLYEYRFENPAWATFDRTANFCMKALAVTASVAAAAPAQ